jgi:hypothetical protein
MAEFANTFSTLRITALIDFFHRPEFTIARKYNVSETRDVSVFRRVEGGTYSL